MQERLITMKLDELTIEALRQMAINRGLICKRGPGAPTQRGNITELLKLLAKEEMSKPAEQE